MLPPPLPGEWIGGLGIFDRAFYISFDHDSYFTTYDLNLKSFKERKTLQKNSHFIIKVLRTLTSRSFSRVCTRKDFPLAVCPHTNIAGHEYDFLSPRRDNSVSISTFLQITLLYRFCKLSSLYLKTRSFATAMLVLNQKTWGEYFSTISFPEPFSSAWYTLCCRDISRDSLHVTPKFLSPTGKRGA